MENKQKKRLHPLIIVVLVLLLLAVILCGVVAGLWLHGRSTLNQPVEAPDLPAQEEVQAEEEAERGTFVEYNGKRYQYNENMRNILLMGIDSDKDPDEAAGSHDQADVLVLAALDLEQDKMTLISISRDTMCDMEIPGENGEPARIINTQLALAYGYGDGQHGSCKLAQAAVSNLFYGLPIHGYAAFYMNGIADLNDAVGGVTLTTLGDFPFEHMGLYHMSAGKTVTLKGQEAVYYIRCRLEHQVDANELRMQRQKQYMLALISQAKQQVLENPASLLTLYDAVDDYVLTDFGLGQISYLGTQAAGMEFTGEIRNVTGELILNEKNMAELHIDQQAMYDLMLEVFYTEVPEEQAA